MPSVGALICVGALSLIQSQFIQPLSSPVPHVGDVAELRVDVDRAHVAERAVEDDGVQHAFCLESGGVMVVLVLSAETSRRHAGALSALRPPQDK